MKKPSNYTKEEERIKDPKTPSQKEEKKDPEKKDREYNLDHETYKKKTDNDK